MSTEHSTTVESFADMDSKAESPGTSEKQEAHESAAEEAPKRQLPPGVPSPADFPDGGRQAWLAVLGGWCCYFCSFGWVSSIGVFQTYYQQNQLSSYSPSDISWILSVEVFMLQVLAPICGKLFDSFGPRGLVLVGTFFHVFGLMMVSISHEYYQIFLAQSICSGLGAACLYHAATNATATWFFKKRGAALGIIATGSSMGGLITPIMYNHLVYRIGFGWTMRAIAFMFLGLQAIALLTVTSRLKHVPKPLNKEDLITPWTEARFMLNAFACFFFFWGMLVPNNFIILYAEYHGMSPSLAGYQVAILNAVSTFGRVIPPAIGDKIGRFNVTIIIGIISVVFLLGLWIPANYNAAIIGFSVGFGFTFGAFVSLIPALVAQISDIRVIGIRVGITFFIVSFAGLTGNPISGALITRGNGDYVWLQVFCGVTAFVGLLLFIAARTIQVGAKLKVKI